LPIQNSGEEEEELLRGKEKKTDMAEVVHENVAGGRSGAGELGEG
jgi:hypothetical protein